MGRTPAPTSSGALAREQRFRDPDAAYRLIVDAHRGLSDEDSNTLNAVLVLALANHIGDVGVLIDAIALAKTSLGKER